MNIIENNKIIAEFMGLNLYRGNWYKSTIATEKKICKQKDLLYHHDWNWLMAVVDKIEGMQAVVKMARHWGTTVKDEVEDMYFCTIKFDNKEIDIAWKDDKIGAVYLAVVEFIKSQN